MLSALFSPELLRIGGFLAELGEIFMLWRVNRSARQNQEGATAPAGTDVRILAALEAVKKYAGVKETDDVDDLIFAGMVSVLFADLPKVQADAIKTKLDGFITYLAEQHKLAERFRYNVFRLRNEELGGIEAAKGVLQDIADLPDDETRFQTAQARGLFAGGHGPIKFDGQRVIQLTRSLGRALNEDVLPTLITGFTLIGDTLRDGAFGVGGSADNPAADSAVGIVRGHRAELQTRKDELRARLEAQQNPPAGGNTGN